MYIFDIIVVVVVVVIVALHLFHISVHIQYSEHRCLRQLKFVIKRSVQQFQSDFFFVRSFDLLLVNSKLSIDRIELYSCIEIQFVNYYIYFFVIYINREATFL